MRQVACGVPPVRQTRRDRPMRCQRKGGAWCSHRRRTTRSAGGTRVVRTGGGDRVGGGVLGLVHNGGRGLPGGTLIGMATTEPAAAIDLPAWCHLTGHEYRGSATADAGSPFIIELAERANPIDPDRPWHRPRVTEVT